MSVSEALNKLMDETISLSNEYISVSKALGRVCVDDILAVKDLPCFDNSALDGYAIKYDKQEDGYVVIGESFAGDKTQLSIKENECVKIMTGAKFPLGADTVLRLEDSEIKNGKIYPIKAFKKGDAHRLKGEEVKINDILIAKHTTLTPAHIMMLNAQGITHINVKSRPKIAIFSSGDEVREPWNYANDDEIYNANSGGIAALLLSQNYKSSYLGIIKDDLNQTIKSISNAQNYDVIICSGGASKGEADYMKKALLTLGYSEIFDHIKIRPGAPTKAYVKDKKIVFILPGNPMAAFLMTFFVVLPFLNNKNHEKFQAILQNDIKVKSGRQNVVLGNYKDGKFYIYNENNYGSGMITPLMKSNAILLTECEISDIKSGEIVKIYRIS
ncbi:molybdopterin molybdotransferase MoeA [Campylobacter majalis]|uniref:molybdopterin molybdotransferase MoeA n=1 Tax=Campylobacter majalis TaxID=2790656 RepID=UPI003D682564